MKMLISFTLVIVSVFSTCLFAQLNYDNALNAVQKTDMTDSGIESTMHKFGFNKAWYEDITMKDKIIALF